jgi:hypothetical protein
MRDAQLLADKFAIANTLALHSRGVDRADFSLLRSAYTDDGGAVSYGFFTGSADDFCRILADAQKSGPVTMHRTSNILIEIDGDSARSESYVIAYMETPAEAGGLQRMIGGRYLDRHERSGEDWKIAHRTYVLDWNLNWPTSSSWPEADDAHFTPRGGHRGADPGRTLLAAWNAAHPPAGDLNCMSDDLDATIDNVLAKQAIHELGMAYCRAVDRGDEALLRSVFHPDATVVSGVVNGGIDEFAPAIVSIIRGNLKSSFHSVANEWVKINGDTAVGESYVTAFTLAGEGSMAMQTISGGRYLDRYARRDGRWKISERVFVMDFNINQPSTALFGEGPYEHLTLRGGFKPDDPVFGFWDS